MVKSGPNGGVVTKGWKKKLHNEKVHTHICTLCHILLG
jgi:hypothetical protein